tara:strand:- start:768 stop:953 length:186 start_codon:yes stop_codon:yes gene_type:complete
MADSAQSTGLDAVIARYWRERFNRHFHELGPNKYDELFRQMRNFCLAGSEAAFDGLGFRAA